MRAVFSLTYHISLFEELNIGKSNMGLVLLDHTTYSIHTGIVTTVPLRKMKIVSLHFVIRRARKEHILSR